MELRTSDQKLELLIVRVERTFKVANHCDLPFEDVKLSLDVKNVHVEENIVSCMWGRKCLKAQPQEGKLKFHDCHDSQHSAAVYKILSGEQPLI